MIYRSINLIFYKMKLFSVKRSVSQKRVVNSTMFANCHSLGFRYLLQLLLQKVSQPLSYWQPLHSPARAMAHMAVPDSSHWPVGSSSRKVVCRGSSSRCQPGGDRPDTAIPIAQLSRTACLFAKAEWPPGGPTESTPIRDSDLSPFCTPLTTSVLLLALFTS